MQPPMKQGMSDDFQSPSYVLDILIPYLKKEWNILECACGKGNLVNGLIDKGFKVIGTDIIIGYDFLQCTSDITKDIDCIITNPPYSLKDEFIKKCYELGKPFALLMPLTALEGQKRQALYKKYGLQLIIPNRRINFETPSGQGTGSWFLTAWFTWGLNLSKDLNFVELIKDEKEKTKTSQIALV